MNTSCNNCRTKHYKFDFIAENGIDGLDSDEDDGTQEDYGTTGLVLSNDVSLDADIILDPLLAHSPPPFPSVSYEDPGPLSPFISLTSSAPWLADVERLHSIAISTPQSTASTPGRLQRPNQWPLPVEEEAMLLRYFIENVSRFTHKLSLYLSQFDVSEPIQYFRVDIPQRARTNATLANAMLALSSRILQWKAGYSPHVADRYYQKCLETLIPALGDEAALVMDDTLLAATIFLRMLEEMDSHISALADGGRHLSGTHAIISIATTSTTTSPPPPTGFRLAAYWTAFRQELWLALHKRQPVTLSVRRVCGFEVDEEESRGGGFAFAPAPDWTWCRRAIAHCGDVLDCIFGGGGGRRTWEGLVGENEAWWKGVPSGFEPFFGGFAEGVGEEGDGEGGFPELRFHLEWHVMGSAYAVLARLLLVVHDPTVPTIGPALRRQEAIAEIDKKARRDVRILCGIGLSNDAVPPAILISCMAVTLFADRFTDRAEQERLYMVLLETERRHGWPTAKARAQLKQLWGC
ncbi:hypothetical protein SLS58_001758 [Diplodia intermedia]|uniref:Arca-like protein n=1 Tax=Diplodia intermedia TaxID=856260 RepID=A0ABR3U0W3_9PEZI